MEKGNTPQKQTGYFLACMSLFLDILFATIKQDFSTVMLDHEPSIDVTSEVILSGLGGEIARNIDSKVPVDNMNFRMSQTRGNTHQLLLAERQSTDSGDTHEVPIGTVKVNLEKRTLDDKYLNERCALLLEAAAQSLPPKNLLMRGWWYLRRAGEALGIPMVLRPVFSRRELDTIVLAAKKHLRRITSLDDFIHGDERGSIIELLQKMTAHYDLSPEQFDALVTYVIKQIQD